MKQESKDLGDVRELHRIKEPQGWASAMSQHHIVGFQAKESARILQEEFDASGRDAWEISFQVAEDSWGGYDWTLLANGEFVCTGTDEFARECFFEGPRVFLEYLRNQVESSGIEKACAGDLRVIALQRKVSIGKARIAQGVQHPLGFDVDDAGGVTGCLAHRVS